MKTIEPTKQKLRGGYYTPPAIADFLIEWALNGDNSVSILEPSMGDGVFIKSLADRLASKGEKSAQIGKTIWGVEFFGEEIQKAKEGLKGKGYKPENFNLIEGDFFSIFKKNLADKKFDVVLGNPPFIRFQDFPEEQRDLALD